ncbi:hypothetical protein ABZZ79_36435 [Streptomyces sp. NPDC006458]|uniref:hypothetical protein n=1 Tax=Streptomyces sp. NPDC006458 TaxID=3154302 RepID=UPI00339FDC31
MSFTPWCNIARFFGHDEGGLPPPVARTDRYQQTRRHPNARGMETMASAVFERLGKRAGHH